MSEEELGRGAGETEEEASKPAGAGSVALLQSSLMNNYGKAMGRAGSAVERVPSASLRTDPDSGFGFAGW
eukprot:919531-Rhodomonas_salina.1